MRATPYNSISEPCDEPGIGSPVQKSTRQFTTPGQRSLNGSQLKCDGDNHPLGAVTFTCQECGQTETRIKRFGDRGLPLGREPKFCESCLKVHDRDHRRKRCGHKPRSDLWTLERKETAAHLWRSGRSASDIVNHLGGVTRNAVIGVLYRMGLLGTRPKERKSQEAIRKRRAECQRAYRAKNGNPRPRKASPAMRGRKAGGSHKSASLPSAVTPLLPPLNLSIIDVKNGQCKFIAGNDRLCCGRPGEPWCPAHWRVVHDMEAVS